MSSDTIQDRERFVNISQRLALTLGIALLALMGIGGFGLYQQQQPMPASNI
jgi:methyl-accepting chemotaxis protein